ncbi:class C sortase [Paenarthrobacter sp. NPDC089714]|uniref:class C sortase n=1 Tax=Paenarthrobacter sp. NPDC089714 TaxID=3364377 RepID=UPI00381FFFBB
MKAKAGRRKGTPPSPVSTASRGIQDQPRRWRLPGVALLVALAMMSGSALLLYPAAAAWFSAVDQSHEIDKLTQGIKDLGAETLHSRLNEAREYNQSLSGGGADIAANERLPLAKEPRDGTGQKYLDMLRGDSEGLMARIRIPSIKVDLPIYHGTSDAVLEHGVGHLEGTALPVGGPSTHSVLTGHRGLATSELFNDLDKVKADDTFTIEVFGEVLTYRVVETLIVEPEETESLLIQPGKDLLTLVTCTPLGINSHRILVTGERVIPTPQAEVDAAGISPDVPGYPWWMVIGGGVVVTAVAYVWLSGRPTRSTRSQSAAARA